MDVEQKAHGPRDCVRRGMAVTSSTRVMKVIVMAIEDVHQVAERPSSPAAYTTWLGLCGW